MPGAAFPVDVSTGEDIAFQMITLSTVVRISMMWCEMRKSSSLWTVFQQEVGDMTDGGR